MVRHGGQERNEARRRARSGGGALHQRREERGTPKRGELNLRTDFPLPIDRLPGRSNPTSKDSKVLRQRGIGLGVGDKRTKSF